MKKIAYLILVAAAGLAPMAAAAAQGDSTATTAVSAPEAAASAVQINAGVMLYTSNGYRLGPVYRVSSQGNPQLILNGKLVTVPASSLSETGGKVSTSLSKKDLGKAG
ncbi:MAG: hypothetical protein ABIT04_02760 [Novosphingobium sp.]